MTEFKHRQERVKFAPQLKTIRTFCLQCMGNEPESAHEVKMCTALDCPLFPFRFGKSPKKEGKMAVIDIYTDEEHPDPEFSS